MFLFTTALTTKILTFALSKATNSKKSLMLGCRVLSKTTTAKIASNAIAKAFLSARSKAKENLYCKYAPGNFNNRIVGRNRQVIEIMPANPLDGRNAHCVAKPK